MKLAINTEVDLDDDELERRIIEAAAEQLIGSVNSRYEEVSAAIRRALEAKAQEVVDRFFASGIQPVDGIGDPKGPRIPVNEFLAAAIKGWMETIVNDRGEPTRDSYGTKMTRGEWLTRKHATEGLAALAKAEVGKVADLAKASIKETIAATVQAVLMKGA
jgi:hypothetical protein